MTGKATKVHDSASWRVLRPQDLQARKERRAFANDVLLGLFESPKSLPSRYFYDEEGNRLFQKIMDLPEYYLANCEMEIFHARRRQIADHLEDAPFNLVELGAGDGTKTTVLLEEFTSRNLDFRYVPIDICREAVRDLVEHCGHTLPQMKTEGLVSEYFDGLHWLSGIDGGRNVVLFLGSNIGNFTDSKKRVFLHSLWNSLNDGDFLLMGFDLKKDIGLLTGAYNDPGGVTAEFNLNLLRRINRELAADFDTNSFEHYATYNVFSGAMESYLVSRKEQVVTIEDLGQVFSFQPWEPIHTEVSRKFLESDIGILAGATGYKVVEQFLDRRGWYVNSLWQVVKTSGGDGRNAS